MKGLIKQLKHQSKENKYFRKVLETGKYTQVVIMSIAPGEEIGEEIHKETDQVLFFVRGFGEVILDGEKGHVEKGDCVLVRAGVKHNFINVGDEDLKIITTYSPPHHPDGLIQKDVLK